MANFPRCRKSWERVRMFIVQVSRRRYWTFEVIYILSSIVLVCVLAGVIYDFKNQPVSAWQSNFTLNAFVSVLVTLMYILLMMPISSCVSQLKWIHFRSSGTVRDFQNLDNISRAGLLQLGSWRMILRRGNGLLPFAFFLTILTVAVGPLSQQILQFGDIHFPVDGYATLPVARNLSSIYMGTANSKLGIAAALSSALFTSSPAEFRTTPVCSTGDCSWNDFATLALQSYCEIVTDKIIFPKPKTISQYLAERPPPRNNTASRSKSQPKVTLGDKSILSIADIQNRFWSDFDLHGPTEMSTGDDTFLDGFSITNVIVSSPIAQDTSTSTEKRKKESVSVQTGIATQKLTVVFLDGNITGKVDRKHMKRTHNLSSMAATSFNVHRRAAWDCTLQFVLQPLKATFSDGNFTESKSGPAVQYDGSLVTNSDDCHTNPECSWLQFQRNDQRYVMDGQFPASIFGATHQMMNGFSWRRLLPNESIYENYNPKYYSQGRDLIHFTAALEVGALEDVPVSVPPNWASAETVTTKVSPTLSTTATTTSSNMPNCFTSVPGQVWDPSTGHGDTPTTVGVLLDNVAAALTKYMREYHPQQQPADTITVTQTAYQAQWPWISIPVALIAGTALLVILTALQTCRLGLPVWTDSAPMTLVHGLDDASRRQLDGLMRANGADLNDPDALERLGRKVKLRLNGPELLMVIESQL